MSLRVLVCGGRDFNDALTFGSWLGGLHKNNGISLIIHGNATGADKMADKFAKWRGIPVAAFPADWRKHGKAAEPMRNTKMLSEGRPDLVVAFEGGKGTGDMVKQATAAGVTVFMAHKVTDQPA